MEHVEVEQVIRAPRQAVWDLYTDHVSWTRWAGMGTVHLEREGVPAPNGVGCVRVISNAGIGVHEEVLEFEAPRRMAYRVIKGGLPMRDHLGEVIFEDHESGTKVIWRCRFQAGLPIPGLGFLFRLLVQRLFARALASLARQPFAAAAAARAEPSQASAG
jgi:uncharacterized protein YndB with AHSA1/START domain